jgi:hypothetical protein
VSIIDQQVTLLDTPLAGLEEIQRTVFYAFFEGMNTAQQQVDAYWQTRDQRFNVVTGRKIPAILLEPIPPQNFHEGHKPSLVLGGPETFPNIAVFANSATPSPEDGQFDQLNSWEILVTVEILVKGENEDETNRRVQRAAESALLCLNRNQTLGGAVTGLTASPTVVISDLFKVASPGQGGAYKKTYVWQGAQITFSVQKDAVIPSDGADTFARSSEVDYSQYIDQG